MAQNSAYLSMGEQLQPPKNQFKITLLNVIISVMAVWGLFDMVTLMMEYAQRDLLVLPNNSPPQCWCGTHNDEAAAMGCVYDHIAVDWLPPHCHDADLVAEFDTSGPSTSNKTWPYYRAESRSILGPVFVPVNEDSVTTIDTLARRGEDYWATTEWHIAHCLFTWRKQVRFQSQDIEGRLVEPWNTKEAHVKHCSDYIWDVVRTGRPLDEINTFIPGTARHIDE
ncbi:hypothetical protein IQ06DRAFT_303396 [Phaeosphaeriaceae sp. SRC1lsM3a]|nr:hypothetical protein IQ06DRAFT_303396 [Stagonospora sp. SRC1lsM3a]